MIDTDVPRSPGWWLKTLGTQLHNRRVGRRGTRVWTRDQVESSRIRPGLDLLEAYRRGDPPLRDDIHSGWGAPFRQYVRMGRLNFAGKLVSPTANRMGLRGFRTAAADDELGDAAANEIMRRNHLKLVARDVHDNMLGLADGYTMVTPPGQGRPHSLITSESPRQCITAHDTATGGTLAGLRFFRDDYDEADVAQVFIRDDGNPSEPGGLYVARKSGPTSIGHRGQFRLGSSWEWDYDAFDDVPGGIVPIFRFRNLGGVGEFEQHLDHLDRINDKIFNEWWISKIQAFRQRAIERDKDAADDDDFDDTDDEATGLDGLNPAMSPQELSEMFVSSPDALWDLPPGARLRESTPIDVGPLVNSIQKELQWLAAAADKPLSSLNPDAANQTAEGASNQKEEHLYQVEDRRDRAEGAWAQTLSAAFAFDGDADRADVTKIEVLWGPLERFSLSQKSSAASQAKDSLPKEAIQRDIWQYDPAEIPELRTMAGRELIFVQPAPAPAPAGQEQGQQGS